MASNVLSPSKYNTPSSEKEAVRLAMLAAAQTDNPYTMGHWSQSYTIRTLIGLLVTVGITFALMRVTDLILLWITPIDAFWKSIGGFFLWQGFQMVGVFFGSMLAAAGRNQMTTLGVLVGITVGFMTLMVFPTNPNLPQALYFAMPAWFAVAGVFGAMVGEWLWHPQPRRAVRVITNSKLTQDNRDASFAHAVRQMVLGMIFANIRWMRVILAVMIIIPTLWYTHDVVRWVLMNFGLIGWANEVGLQKAWFETMIKLTVIILTVTLVGAGTSHGIAHGFWTGVFCGVINLLLHVFLPKEEVLPVDAILWEVGWVFILCIISGGFGALVLPPMMYLAQKRRPASLR